jgi:hypothetical protein
MEKQNAKTHKNIGNPRNKLAYKLAYKIISNLGKLLFVENSEILIFEI